MAAASTSRLVPAATTKKPAASGRVRRPGAKGAGIPKGMMPPPDRPLVNPGLSRAQLLEIHRFMRLNRMLEDKLTALYRQGRISGGLYSSLGQEAISVGTAYALAPDDLLAPMIRNIGSMLVRGVTPLDFFQQYMGRYESPTHGKDGTLHFGNVERLSIIGPISHLGTLVPVMAGAALAARLRGEAHRCSLTYVGDGATSTGYFHEGLNFAAVLKLPFILVVENNGYAYSTTCDRQFRVASIAERGPAYGVASESVDGTDVLAVYAATQRAVQRGRRGEGATLLETRCLRMQGHAQHDDMRYVPKALLEAWAKRDPLERYERFLVASGHATPDTLRATAEAIAPELDAAADAAEKCPPPSPEETLKGVYKEEGYEAPWWPAA
ncbi:MAG TPA: thiamine pyrophosphate-dependent dehydrogenase E1 component subunit alpha [Verrucomicrobiae bacterium]|nr:thiamine pyrophosphate-dependent dehydrogenase E1 component subunit alpha [Verrucomicrobiae bacterium]